MQGVEAELLGPRSQAGAWERTLWKLRFPDPVHPQYIRVGRSNEAAMR